MGFSDFFQQLFLRKKSGRFFVLIGLGIVIIFSANGVVRLHQKFTLIRAEREKKQAELTKLIKKREQLEKEIAFLQSGGAVEREAKSRLNFKKPEEEVVIVVTEEKKELPLSASVPYIPTVWDKIHDFFVKFFLP